MIALSSNGPELSPRYANRHGLITGATGSGKTMSVLRLISEFHRIGVPCFVPDVKGDVGQHLRGASAVGGAVRYLVPGRNMHLSLLRLGADLAARALGLPDAQQGMLEAALANGVRPVHTPRDVMAELTPQDGGTASFRAMARALSRVNGNQFFGPLPFDVADMLSSRAMTAPITVLDAKE